MHSRLIAAALCAGMLAAAGARAEEVNGWPLVVRPNDPAGGTDSVQHLGPLVFRKESPDAKMRGVRPLTLQSISGDLVNDSFLYPSFTWRRQGDFRSFSFFQLVNVRQQPDGDSGLIHAFDVWPFYFSRETGTPEDNYHAFFPVGGTIKHRFGKDRIHFVLFPLYSEVEKGGLHTTHAPWPFLRFIDGAGHHGFEFWPLGGRRGREGDYDRQFYLWPLFYKSATNLSAPQPNVKLGALPFYTRDTGPGFVSETFGWPFFGYTHRTAPYRFDEQRYFWPLIVQARGDQRYVNRWAPFYTHSVIKGYDKSWLLWPLLRQARWEDGNIGQQKDQLLFFVYWSVTQRSLSNPDAAPAHKTHLWPLLSSWDNGAGRRQLQVLSPLEVFFPNNDTIRELYTPLFALYRYDSRGPGESRHSLLWDAVTYRRSAGSREFHLGPLFSVASTNRARRIAIGNGLIGVERRPNARGWRPFLFDFARKRDNKPVEATKP